MFEQTLLEWFLMEYRVEQLATRADVSVDTIRFYQSKGLLPHPRREGRVAWYGEDHLRRLERIRSLQAKGLTLATIRRLLDGELDAADEALVSAVSATHSPAGPTELISLDELAVRTGVPLPLLQAVEREQLLVPRRVGGATGYTIEDAEVVSSGLVLLEAGLPLPEVLTLARRHHDAMRQVAEHAVELFDVHVRRPVRDAGVTDEEGATRLVEAFERLLPATTALVSHHFRRLLLSVAQDHIERVGEAAEVAAVNERAAVTP